MSTMQSKHSMVKPSLLLLQPRLYSYRSSIFEALTSKYNICGLFDLKCDPPSFTYSSLPEEKLLKWLTSFIKFVIVAKKNKNKIIVFSPAYTTHLGIVISVLLSSLFGVKVVIHGQANFRKNRNNLAGKVIGLFWLAICNKYISYSHLGLSPPYQDSHKVTIIYNRYESLSLLGISSYPVINDVVFSQAYPLKLLFIGRNRPNCGLELLTSALLSLIKVCTVELHVISDSLHTDHKSIVFHGNLYGNKIIEISKICHIGIYAGNAGLSILHYMCLGLCPITHDSIFDHSGPEPDYIKSGYNGFTFKKDSVRDLVSLIEYLYSNPKVIYNARQNAFISANDIHRKPYSADFDEVFQSL